MNGDLMKQMNEAVVGSSLVEIPKSGHVVPLASPVGRAAALQAFLVS